VEIHETARKHGVPDEDIRHAFEHVIGWVEIGDDPLRYLLAGPGLAGNLLELVLLVSASAELVIHAMTLRTSTAATIFGAEA
jgi:hypothetical protein